jgi:hypothetical protein
MPRCNRWPAPWVLGALLAPAAFAGDKPVVTPAPYEAPVAPKVVCKNESVVGTKIKRRTCRSETEIEGTRKASQEWLKDIQNEAVMQRKQG